MRWFSDALYRLNIEYDMISSKERDFSSYECLIVPALYSAPESLLLALDSYVRNGGHLITTFRSGFSDEYLKIYPDMQPHICMNVWDFTTISLHTRIMWISCRFKAMSWRLHRSIFHIRTTLPFP